MLTEIIMPKMSNTQFEGQLIQWMKQEGDFVEAGDILMEILTDKVSMTVEATSSGYIRRLLIEPGDVAPIGQVIGYMTRKKDEEVPSKYLGMSRESVLAEKGHEIPVSSEDTRVSAERATPSDDSRVAVNVSPRARKLLKEHGLSAAEIPVAGKTMGEKEVQDFLREKRAVTPKSTGAAKAIAAEMGIDISSVQQEHRDRITKKDVERTIAALGDRTEKYMGVRKIVGERLASSKKNAPHVYFENEVNMENALAFKDRVNAFVGHTSGSGRIGLNVIIIFAAVHALKDFPHVNASLREEEITRFGRVDIGVAVDTPGGLMVPKLRNCESMDLRGLAEKYAEIVKRAKEAKLTADELNDGTFTVSNLGMFGIDFFTAVINPPEAAILAVGGVKKRPVADGDSVRVAPVLNLCLSADHRILDGVLCAKFLGRIREYLEMPDLLSL
jgi:pyruvate dehydrogenase E2 component (dihydrolipoamide acetyltransferase)